MRNGHPKTITASRLRDGDTQLQDHDGARRALRNPRSLGSTILADLDDGTFVAFAPDEKLTVLR